MQNCAALSRSSLSATDAFYSMLVAAASLTFM